MWPMPTQLLSSLLLILLVGCGKAGGQLQNCVMQNNAYGAGFIDALAAVEQHLLDTGALSERTLEGYLTLIEAVENSERLPSLESYCTKDENCWLLTTPASTAAYLTCPTRIGAHNPLEETAQWGEQTGEIGGPYLRRVLNALDEEAFEQILYRGALLQPLVVMMEASTPDSLRDT